MQLVNYTQPRVFSIAVALNEKTLRHVILKPGVNELRDEDWEAVKAHPDVVEAFDVGHLEMLKSKPGNEIILKSMSEADGLKLIDDTFAVELIQKWIALETRPRLLQAMSEKLKSLVLPERREKVLGDTEEEVTQRASGDDEEFPRADKLGEDNVARKLAGRSMKAKAKRK